MVDNIIEALKGYDKEVAEGIASELQRQRRGLELIASENLVSEAVMLAMGTPLTNKYAEGYPEKRYYGGCECVDVVEKIAIERACKLFGADHANVQPHSGAQANTAVYFALINPGDTVLGMNLAHGGHLTHGSPVNMSGKYFNFVPYGVNDDGFIDYDELERIAKEAQPKLIVAGASAYPRVIDFERISKIAKEVGAYFMVDMAHIAGLVAAGLHPSPVPYADVVTTTTHKTLRGPRGGLILCREELAKAIDKAIFPGTQGGPLMHTIASKAVCFGEALKPEFKKYQEQIVKNARTLAKSVICSSLTKAAIFGHDANWGRILCALGYSGVKFDPENVDLYFQSVSGKIHIFGNGVACDYSEEEATKILSDPEVTALVDMHMGDAQATAWGCDLSYDYVKINADYRS